MPLPIHWLCATALVLLAVRNWSRAATHPSAIRYVIHMSLATLQVLLALVLVP